MAETLTAEERVQDDVMDEELIGQAVPHPDRRAFVAATRNRRPGTKRATKTASAP